MHNRNNSSRYLSKIIENKPSQKVLYKKSCKSFVHSPKLEIIKISTTGKCIKRLWYIYEKKIKKVAWNEKTRKEPAKNLSGTKNVLNLDKDGAFMNVYFLEKLIECLSTRM